MDLKIPLPAYSGFIREVTIGTGEKAVTVGGQKVLNYHCFDGEFPRLPLVALEVWDSKPENWPAGCQSPYQDVLDQPAAWAKKCVQEYRAQAIAIQLVGTDPMGQNRSAAETCKIVEKVLEAVNVPIFIFGCDHMEKDAEVLKAVAEVAAGRNVALGPVQEKNYKAIGAAAIAYKHTVMACTPIDVNLAKQLNILLLELGVPENKILIDPTSASLGYGLEYTYSVMERDRLAALTQQDDKLAFPLVCNLGKEVWKTKEASLPRVENPAMGDELSRGIMMEAITAALLSLAGADIVVMRHPQAAELFKNWSQQLIK